MKKLLIIVGCLAIFAHAILAAPSGSDESFEDDRSDESAERPRKLTFKSSRNSGADSDESVEVRRRDLSDESAEKPIKFASKFSDDSGADSDESVEVRRRDLSDESAERPRKFTFKSSRDSGDDSDESVEAPKSDNSAESKEEKVDDSSSDEDDSQSPFDLFFQNLRGSGYSRAQQIAILKSLFSRYNGGN